MTGKLLVRAVDLDGRTIQLEGLIKARRLRDVVGNLFKQGVPKVEIVHTCTMLQHYVPLLGRVNDIKGRVANALKLIDENEVPSGNTERTKEIVSMGELLEFDDNERAIQSDDEVVLRVYGLSHAFAEEVRELIQAKFGHLDLSIQTYDLVRSE